MFWQKHTHTGGQVWADSPADSLSTWPCSVLSIVPRGHTFGTGIWSLPWHDGFWSRAAQFGVDSVSSRKAMQQHASVMTRSTLTNSVDILADASADLYPDFNQLLQMLVVVLQKLKLELPMLPWFWPWQNTHRPIPSGVFWNQLRPRCVRLCVFVSLTTQPYPHGHEHRTETWICRHC